MDVGWGCQSRKDGSATVVPCTRLVTWRMVTRFSRVIPPNPALRKHLTAGVVWLRERMNGVMRSLVIILLSQNRRQESHEQGQTSA